MTVWFPPADVEFDGVKVAVISVEDATLTFETLIFDPALTVAPAANPVPVIVTSISVPTNPWAGLIPVIDDALIHSGLMPPVTKATGEELREAGCAAAAGLVWPRGAVGETEVAEAGAVDML